MFLFLFCKHTWVFTRCTDYLMATERKCKCSTTAFSHLLTVQLHILQRHIYVIAKVSATEKLENEKKGRISKRLVFGVVNRQKSKNHPNQPPIHLHNRVIDSVTRQPHCTRTVAQYTWRRLSECLAGKQQNRAYYTIWKLLRKSLLGKWKREWENEQPKMNCVGRCEHVAFTNWKSTMFHLPLDFSSGPSILISFGSTTTYCTVHRAHPIRITTSATFQTSLSHWIGSRLMHKLLDS